MKATARGDRRADGRGKEEEFKCEGRTKGGDGQEGERTCGAGWGEASERSQRGKARQACQALGSEHQERDERRIAPSFITINVRANSKN